MTLGDLFDKFGLNITMMFYGIYILGCAVLGFYSSRLSRWWYEVTGDFIQTFIFSAAFMLSGLELMLFIIQGILND